MLSEVGQQDESAFLSMYHSLLGILLVVLVLPEPSEQPDLSGVPSVMTYHHAKKLIE